MNRMIIRLLSSIIVLLAVVLGGFLYKYATDHWRTPDFPSQAPVTVAIQSSTVAASTEQPQSPLPTPTFIAPGTLVATPAPQRVWATPPLPAIQWSDPPPCENHPLVLTDWRQRVIDDPLTTRLFLQRVQSMSTSLQILGDADQLAKLFLEEGGIDVQKTLLQNKIGLWLNVMRGYLNRETEIQVGDLPDVKTVGALTELGEQDLKDETAIKVLTEAIQAVLTGKAITAPACAHMLVRQFGGDLRSIVWKSQGVTRETYPIMEQLQKERLTPTELLVSPDYRTVAIETECCEATGGPVYLYDLNARTLTNLNLQLAAQSNEQKDSGLTPLNTGEYWQVIGWHPDSKHLLLGVNGSKSVFWVDLSNDTFERITLDDHPMTMLDTSRSNVDLLPDGSGIVYIMRVGDEIARTFEDQLMLFDLTTRTSHLLLKWPDPKGRLFNPRVSPDGEKVVFLVEAGPTLPELQYSLQIYNFKTERLSEVLASDHLGHITPVWSPDGKSLAFPWGDPSTSGHHLFPDFDGWLGNIWVATLEKNAIQQITHIQGAVRRPVWSLDGTILVFYLHNNQFGATQLNNDKQLWQISSEGVSSWGFGTQIYLP